MDRVVTAKNKAFKSVSKSDSPKDRLELMAHIIDRLAMSVDHDITLQEVAKLLVPSIADYSRVAIVDENSQLKEISVNHKDPSKASLASELFDNYKGRPESTHGVEKILQSGRAEMIEVVDKKVLSSVKNNKPLYESVKKIGLKSYMGVPLIARGKIIGAITFSSVRNGRFYTKEDLKFAQEIGNRIALVLDNARLYKQAQEEIAERKDSEKELIETQNKLLFLAEASKLLSSSLDYKTTINNVARLAIPHVADWYIVDVLNPEGEVELLSVAHKDPKMVKFAKEYRQTHPIDLNADSGAAKVIKTGKSEFFPVITDEMLVAGIKDKKELKLMRSLGFASIIEVPLLIRGTTLGAITFIMTDSKRHFTKTDLAMTEELGGRVALAIQNAKLYSSAQTAVAIRDEFISVASHELKTPITSLKLYAQVLQQQYKNRGEESLLKYFDKMDNQINKLSELVRDLLDVSRLEYGKMDFNMEPIDLDDVIKEAIDILSPITKNHKIVVKGNLDKKVYGDRYRLYQVITNLLTNAVKYSPDSKKVVITLEDKKDNAQVNVRDYGIGIDKGHLREIFGKFYRVTEPTERTFPGLGMGLYIASEIVKRHGGRMSVKSIKRKGSEFSFTIPNKLKN